jgi:hypothetical protein
MQGIVSDVVEICHAYKSLLPTPKACKFGSGQIKRYDLLAMDPRSKHDFFGRCFHVTSFAYYALGDSRAGYKLCRLPAFEIDQSLESQTHWVVESPDGEIIDPTIAQFEPFGFDVTTLYKTRIGAKLGFPYFTFKGKKSSRFHEIVPCIAVMRLAQAMQIEKGTAHGLNWWLEKRSEFYETDQRPMVHADF